MLPNVTGGSFQNNFSPSVSQSGFASAFAPASSAVPWDVSAGEKASSDKFFDGLDKFGRGLLEGDVAVPFMLESKLPEVVLAAVWDLADIRKEGNLSRDEFAVAMYLIKAKLAGRELPDVLPSSLVPPSLRNQANAPNQQQQQQQQQPSAAQDLFDAFGDSPPSSAVALPPVSSSAFSNGGKDAFGASAFGGESARFSPFVRCLNVRSDIESDTQAKRVFTVPAEPERDLMGEDDNPFGAPGPAFAPPAPVSRSAISSPQPSAPPPPPPVAPRAPAPPPPELTRLRSEHSTLSSAVSGLQSTGLELENQTLAHNKEIMDLQAKLISLRSTHDSENGNVEKLRKKAADQAEEMKTLSQDLIRAESELSGLRGEKDSLDGQIMRDREDVREMKRRMVEVGEETIKMKAAVDKIKKDARQQKGLVTITKKQLSTSEAERDKTSRDLEDAQNGVGIEDLQSAPTGSPFDTFAPVHAGSAFLSPTNSTLQTASHIPLPETPARVLSPTASIKSNNPFDRFVATPPTAPPASLPSSESPQATPPAAASVAHEPAQPIKDLAAAVEDSTTASELPKEVDASKESHLLPEPLDHAKDVAVGGIIAAGTAIAGVGAALFASVGGGGHDDHEDRNDDVTEQSAEPIVDSESSATAPTTTATFDDSFGASVPTPAVASAGEIKTEDGFPVAASRDEDGVAAANFAGFDDGFEDGFEPVGSSIPISTAPEGVQTPSEVPFETERFDSGFGDEFVPIATLPKDDEDGKSRSRFMWVAFGKIADSIASSTLLFGSLYRSPNFDPPRRFLISI